MKLKPEDRAEMEAIKELLETLQGMLGNEEQMGEIEAPVVEAGVEVVEGEDLESLEEAVEPEVDVLTEEEAEVALADEDDGEDIDLKKLFRL